MPESKLVYTTSGSNVCGTCGKSLRKCKCLSESSQASASATVLRTPQIQLQKKGRAGKVVTVISHLGLSGAELLDLLQMIKKSLGTGGALKDQTLEIQGDRIAEAEDFLAIRGFTTKKI